MALTKMGIQTHEAISLVEFSNECFVTEEEEELLVAIAEQNDDPETLADPGSALPHKQLTTVEMHNNNEHEEHPHHSHKHKNGHSHIFGMLVSKHSVQQKHKISQLQFSQMAHSITQVEERLSAIDTRIQEVHHHLTEQGPSLTLNKTAQSNQPSLSMGVGGWFARLGINEKMQSAAMEQCNAHFIQDVTFLREMEPEILKEVFPQVALRVVIMKALADEKLELVATTTTESRSSSNQASRSLPHTLPAASLLPVVAREQNLGPLQGQPSIVGPPVASISGAVIRFDPTAKDFLAQSRAKRKDC